ncbi:MAG TPA: hypothetical protein VGL94_13345 [Ktedonobacteraceae bacterium]|jgi:hypothetical protein
MDNLGPTLAKIVALAGGVIAGALLTEWLDKLLAARAQEQPEQDNSYYAQGLKPHSQPTSDEDYQK